MFDAADSILLDMVEPEEGPQTLSPYSKTCQISYFTTLSLQGEDYWD